MLEPLKAEICKILPDVSPTTVEAVLGVMVKNGTLSESEQVEHHDMLNRKLQK